MTTVRTWIPQERGKGEVLTENGTPIAEYWYQLGEWWWMVGDGSPNTAQTPEMAKGYIEIALKVKP